jgi:hypothetical protein
MEELAVNVIVKHKELYQNTFFRFMVPCIREEKNE